MHFNRSSCATSEDEKKRKGKQLNKRNHVKAALKIFTLTYRLQISYIRVYKLYFIMIEKSILNFHIKLSGQLKMLNERSKKTAHAWEEKNISFSRFCATVDFMNETYSIKIYSFHKHTFMNLLWNVKCMPCVTCSHRK